jgi:hypothetical protein
MTIVFPRHSFLISTLHRTLTSNFVRRIGKSRQTGKAEGVISHLTGIAIPGKSFVCNDRVRHLEIRYERECFCFCSIRLCGILSQKAMLSKLAIDHALFDHSINMRKQCENEFPSRLSRVIESFLHEENQALTTN